MRVDRCCCGVFRCRAVARPESAVVFDLQIVLFVSIKGVTFGVCFKIVAMLLRCALYSGCVHRVFCDNHYVDSMWTSISCVVFVVLIGLHAIMVFVCADGLGSSLSVFVVAQQWLWTVGDLDFYIRGVCDLSVGDLRLACVTNCLDVVGFSGLRWVFSSADVIHSFTVLGCGIKADAVPGRLSELCMHFDGYGSTCGQCSELCGSLHNFMPISIVWVVF